MWDFDLRFSHHWLGWIGLAREIKFLKPNNFDGLLVHHWGPIVVGSITPKAHLRPFRQQSVPCACKSDVLYRTVDSTIMSYKLPTPPKPRPQNVKNPNFSIPARRGSDGLRHSMPKSTVFLVRRGRTLWRFNEKTKRRAFATWRRHACDQRSNVSVGFLSDVVSLH